MQQVKRMLFFKEITFVKHQNIVMTSRIKRIEFANALALIAFLIIKREIIPMRFETGAAS
jgi:hypothetical protein